MTQTTLRQDLLYLVQHYDSDAINHLATLVGVSRPLVISWIDGVRPEPRNAALIRAAVSRVRAGEITLPNSVEAEDPTILPSTGVLPESKLITLDEVRSDGDQLWGIASLEYGEQVFVSKGHMRRLQKAGAQPGQRFWGVYRESSKSGSGFPFELIQSDVQL